MFKISTNKIITMNRGEYGSFPLFINIGDQLNPERYILTGEDKLCFYLSEPHQLFENSIIQKVYTKDDLNEEGDVVITFESKDTFYLVPGNYYYEAKLVRGDQITTAVPRSKFIILE